MFSMPPAICTSASPALMLCAALTSACIPDEQLRATV